MFNYSFVVLNTIIQTIDRMMIYQQNMKGSLFEKMKKQTKYNCQHNIAKNIFKRSNVRPYNSCVNFEPADLNRFRKELEKQSTQQPPNQENDEGINRYGNHPNPCTNNTPKESSNSDDTHNKNTEIKTQNNNCRRATKHTNTSTSTLTENQNEKEK
jgi:hypothetical protein